MEDKLDLNLIKSFIEFNKFNSDPNVIGIVFYGSHLWGLSDKSSDIDLHIIIKEGESRRKIQIYNGYKFECIIHSLSKMYEILEFDLRNNRTMVYSMIGHGKVLKDTDNQINILRQKIIEGYQNTTFTKLTPKETKSNLLKIHIDIERLQLLYCKKDKYFDCLYFNLLNKIRVFYEKKEGLSTDISLSKVSKFYNCENYNKNKFKILPDLSFRKLYYKCYSTRSKHKRLHLLKELFNFVSLENEFDFNNCEVEI